MKRLSHAKKRDANEPEIVKTLIKLGASVERQDTPCDLLVGYLGRNILVEVKTETGTQTEDQEKFKLVWKGELPWTLVTTKDAIRMLNHFRHRAGHKTFNQKE